MCGLPGSGKTTVAKTVERALPAVRLSPDEWLAELGFDLFDAEARDRVQRRQWLHAQDLLVAGIAVILEDGFWERSARDEKRLRARELGAEVELRYLDVSMVELERRLARRNREPGEATITPELLRQWQPYFEVPTRAELDQYDPPLH